MLIERVIINASPLITLFNRVQADLLPCAGWRKLRTIELGLLIPKAKT